MFRVLIPHFAAISLLLMYAAAPLAGDEGPRFTHPGLTHGADDLAFIATQLAESRQPWVDAFAKLRDHPQARADYRMRGPFKTVTRGAGETRHDTEMALDANAAFENAMMWRLTGDRAHADKALEILNAWGATLQRIKGHDAILAASLYGFKFVCAAELMRDADSGWAPEDVDRFRGMLRRAIVPTINNFAPFANGNWDTACIKTLMAIGVFCDDRALFDRAVEYYRHGEGNGRLTHYIINPAGQCQESGRDQQHTQLGLAHLAAAAEIAWRQGVDLYAEADNRLLAGFEYTARYNLGHDVPFVPHTDTTGKYTAKHISDHGRGRLRPIYEMVLNHYSSRRGLDAPWTRQAAEKLRPEGPAFRCDHLGFGTLLFYHPPN